MKAQIDNLIMSSFLIWLDNKILTKGEAFKNYNGRFYPIPNLYFGLYSYGLPFKQIVCDKSIPNANLLSGVYINSSFSPIGQNYLSGVNPLEGQVYFGQNISSPVSGSYAVKDFNLYLTSEPEENILFETQYKMKPKTSQNPTGLAPNSVTYPAIFIKNNGGNNTPYAFGGLDKTLTEIRLIVLAESIFDLDALTSILRDTVRTYMPIIRNSPFNNYGFLNNGYYDYNILKSNVDEADNLFISEVNISKISNIDNKLNPAIFPAIIDFSLENIRYPRI